MNKTAIDWPGLTHTLNPVTGCKRNCSLKTHGFDCYARELHNMRHVAYMQGKKLSPRYRYPFHEIHYWPEIFDTVPKNPKKPTKIFIGSMSDICYWKEYYIQETIDFCNSRPNIEFMFLTKDPTVYFDYKFPLNCILGVTATSNKYFNLVHVLNCLLLEPGRSFVSIEPILGDCSALDLKDIGLVIVGADSNKGAKPPKQEWIDSIKHHNIHFKKNILRYI